MKEEGLDVYVIPTADAHNSEYVGECDKRRAFISGFTGSAGVAVVTLSASAHLFTDSRYWSQAEKEIDENWKLQKVGSSEVKNWDKWLLELEKGTRVGIDPSLLDYGTAKSLRSDLDSVGVSLEFPSGNLVDAIWDSRPRRSSEPIQLHPMKFAGKASSEKLQDLRAYLEQHKSTFRTTSGKLEESSFSLSYLVTSLSPIAWMLNMRGNDIKFNPMFYAYLLVDAEHFTVWVQPDVASEEVHQAVESIGGRIRNYDQFLDDLSALQGKVITDSKVNMAVVNTFSEDRITLVKSPVEEAQSRKNPIELQGFRNAYLRDGAAWARWAAWLEDHIKKTTITEWQAAEKLTEFRKQNDYFAGLAYDNISATGENAALPHYSPSPTNSTPISHKTPYLNDSGAQYLDGTIDTTRTMHFGKPTKEQMRGFTRTMQGHIAIDRVVFPEGTTGAAIEVLARQPLWSDGMNYNHGTGHGVGSYLSVHETQIGLSGSSLAYFNTPLAVGHVTSNEPAYYEVGSYGIRLESVLGVKEVQTRRQFGDKKWLGFERFTTVPIEPRMVDFSLISKEERSWLYEHNKNCEEKLKHLVADDKLALKWLARNSALCKV